MGYLKKDWITGAEAIRFMNVSRTTFYKLAREKRIKSKMDGKTPRFLVGSLLDALAAMPSYGGKDRTIELPSSSGEGMRRVKQEQKEELDKVRAEINSEAKGILDAFRFDTGKSEEHNQTMLRKQLLALADNQQIASRLFTLLESESEAMQLKVLQEIFKHLLPAQSATKVQHSPSAQWRELVEKMETIREEIKETAAIERDNVSAEKDLKEYSPEFLEILEVTETQYT